MTLGVRLIVPDEEGRILLVRHGYVKGWHLPGGGVETRETAEATAHKELFEETGLSVSGPIRLLGVFANRKASKRDHVLLYLAPDWERTEEFSPNHEIAEIGFFDLDDLPAETTLATKARLSEVYRGQAVSPYW